MSNRTYVCLDCRTAKRAQTAGGLIHDYRCSKCSKPLSELSKRWRIPSKDDAKGWSEVRAVIMKDDQQWTPRRTKIGIDKIKKIDGRISAVERKAATPMKDKQLKKLLFERKTQKKAYNLEGVV